MEMLRVLLLMLWEVVSGGLSSTNFRKVTPLLPEDVSRCLLEEVHLNLVSTLVCAAFCDRHPDCFLYCLKGSVCSLFSAKVSGRWTGATTVSVLNWDRCYSSWYRDNNLTSFITATSASSVIVAAHKPEFAINGFNCKTNVDFCFKSILEQDPWWRADLGTSSTVSSIIISTKNGGKLQFIDVVITLGNSSDYNNTIFDTYPGEAPNHVSINFTPPAPVTGRYLQVQSVGYERLMFCDIIVLN